MTFNREEYKSLCEEMAGLLRLEKEVAKKKAELRDAIAEMAGGDRMEYGIKVTFRTAKGTVDYNKVVTDLGIDGATIEKYRKPERSYVEIKTY